MDSENFERKVEKSPSAPTGTVLAQSASMASICGNGMDATSDASPCTSPSTIEAEIEIAASTCEFDWFSSTTSLDSKPISDLPSTSVFNAGQIRWYRGVVKKVLSGDTIVICLGLEWNGVPLPEIELKSLLTMAPTMATVDSEDEPYAWDAREYLRIQLINKRVLFHMSSIAKSEKFFIYNVYLGVDTDTDESFLKTLVRIGLSTVCIENFQAVGLSAEHPHPLVENEDKAVNEELGLWSMEFPIRNIHWITENAESIVAMYEGAMVDAIIEEVIDGSTVKVLILQDFRYVVMHLSGILCHVVKRNIHGKPELLNQQPYALDALYYVEMSLLHQDVKISFDAVRHGAVYGTIIKGEVDIAILLLKEGLAFTCDCNEMMLPQEKVVEILEAEQFAKQRRLRLWNTSEAVED